MERSQAEALIEKLVKHPPLTPNVLPNRDYFINLLVSTDVPPSKRFYEEIDHNEVEINDPAMDFTHRVALRRVLRNNLARENELSLLKALYEAVVSKMGVYDSDVFTRRLRTDKDLVRMMAQSGQQYSLLGKLETFDELSGKISTRPLLIIPNAPDLDRITAWEIANIKKPKEGLLGYLPRMSRRKYA